MRQDIERTMDAARHAGCDEAERLGYGSELGYVEAAAIADVAARVVAEQLRGAVEALELLRDGLEGGIDGVGDIPFEARLILQARVREGLRRAERRDE